LHPVAALFLVLVAVTSLGAYGVGIRRLRLRTSALTLAMSRTLACLGLVLIFLGANMVLGVTMILAIRATGRFVPLYIVDDVTLVILSLLQGLVFARWLESSWDPRDPHRSSGGRGGDGQRNPDPI
jgi:hypothetical protein